MKSRSQVSAATKAALPEIPPQPPPPRAERAFGGTSGQWQHCGMSLGGAVEECPKCGSRNGGVSTLTATRLPDAPLHVDVFDPAAKKDFTPEKTAEAPAPQVVNNVHVTKPIVETFTELKTSEGTIEVTLGEQLFAPVQFFSFRIGPYKASKQLQPGEDPVAVAIALSTQLKHFQELDFAVQLKQHLKMVKQAHEATRAAGLESR